MVTGAGGQLATAFELLLDGEVRMSSEASLDIRDRAAVAAAVHAFAPDVILHTAAYTNVDAAESNPATARAVNVDGTRSIVDAVRGTHTIVVYFSTDYVFSGEKNAPYVESDPTSPLNTYGRTKLAGEAEVLSWSRGVVIRTSWLFSETGTNFVKTILAAARAREASGVPLRVVDDQVGSPTFASHLAEAVIEALGAGIGPGLYHMAGSGYCSWLELAREVVALAGLSAAIEPTSTAELARPALRPSFSALVSERPIPRLPHWADGVGAAVDRLLSLT
ncbi:MAG: dTDP-4-dehydrorhamnose reductase [Thermoleophilia bacterium]